MPNNSAEHPQDPRQNPEAQEKENLFYDGVLRVLRFVMAGLLIWTAVNIAMLVNCRRALRPDFTIGRITSAPASFGETHGFGGFLAGFMLPEENAG